MFLIWKYVSLLRNFLQKIDVHRRTNQNTLCVKRSFIVNDGNPAPVLRIKVFATLAKNCCESMRISFVMSVFLFVFPPSNPAEHAITSKSSQCRLLLLILTLN